MQSKETSSLDRVMDVLESILNNLSFILLLTVVVSTFLQVLFRRVFNASLVWSEELARYAGIWVIMLGMAVAFKNREHIAIDFFAAKTPPPVHKALMVLGDLVTIAAMGLFTWYTIAMLRATATIPSPAMRIPMGVVYIGMLAGAVFSVLFAVYAFMKMLQNGIRYPGEQREDGDV